MAFIIYAYQSLNVFMPLFLFIVNNVRVHALFVESKIEINSTLHESDVRNRIYKHIHCSGEI